MKIYIATSLSNKERAEMMGQMLEKEGHILTAPWFRWPPVGWGGKNGTKELQERGAVDLQGVREADVVLAIMPGGSGTHVEIGLALAWQKPVLLWTPEGTPDPTYPCVFYYVKGVTRAWHSSDEEVLSLLRHLASAVKPWVAEQTLQFAGPARSATGCLHDACPNCQGTGFSRTGKACVHAISCPCPRCSVSC